MTAASWTLHDVFGSGRVFVPTPSFDATGWLPRDRHALDFLTGAQLALAGDFPLVCHRAVATPAALAFLEEAGHPRPTRLYRYEDAASYASLLAALDRDLEIVLQHSHPPGAIDDERLWIGHGLLRFVNNKQHLLEFVPAAHAPARSVLHGAELEALAASPIQRPLVLKAAEDLSSGAGCGVHVCHSSGDVRHAVRRFRQCRAVVVEEFVPFEVSWCVQFVIAPDGSLRDAGSAKQICDPSGAYRGSWLVAPDETPSEAFALGRGIAKRVASRGYRGFLGVDIGRDARGRVLAFDINGRFTGSAVALALFPSLARAGCRVARSGSWVGSGSFASMERTLREAMARGAFMPLALYDPRDTDASAQPRVKGMLLGHTREDIVEQEKLFAVAGLC